MTGGGKAEIGSDGGEGLVRIAEEAFGFLRFFFQDEVRQTLARLLLEFAGEVRAAEEKSLRFAQKHYVEIVRILENSKKG